MDINEDDIIEDEDDQESAENQLDNTHDILEKEKKNRAEHLAPWQFKPGQSGNPGGRPAGRSLKEYAKQMLSSMDDEERQQFMKGLSKDIIWRMAEGNPKQDTEINPSGNPIVTVIKYAEQQGNKPTP